MSRNSIKEPVTLISTSATATGDAQGIPHAKDGLIAFTAGADTWGTGAASIEVSIDGGTLWAPAKTLNSSDPFEAMHVPYGAMVRAAVTGSGFTNLVVQMAPFEL